MATLRFEATLDNGQVIRGLGQIQDKVTQTSKHIKDEAGSAKDAIDDIKDALEGLAAGVIVKGFIEQMMEVRGQFQQTEMAFETMLGSKQKADALMKQMIQTAATTPFGVTDVTDGAKQLLAFNVSAEQVNDTLIRLGDIAAGMGLRMSDMVMLYGTTIAKGKMDTQDMYQHLNRGIPIAEALAKVMGLDVNNAIAEVSKAIKKHKVDSDTYIKAMQAMTSEGSKFGGLMAAQSQTITGRIETIKDGVEQMFNELGRSQEGIIGTGLDLSATLVDNWRTIGKVILPVIVAYGSFKAAQLTVIAVTKAWQALKVAETFVITAARVISLARAYGVATVAAKLLNATMSANIIGAVVAVVATGIAMFKSFGSEVENTANITKKFGEEASTATNNVQTLVSVIKTADTKSKTYKDAMEELSGIYNDYGIKLSKVKDDESNLNDIKQEAINKSIELTEAIKTESIERQRANELAAASEKYKSVVKSTSTQLSNDLSFAGNNAAGLKVGLEQIYDTEKLRAYNEAIQKTRDLTAAGKTNTEEYAKAQKAMMDAFQASDVEVRKLASAFGLSTSETAKLLNAAHTLETSLAGGIRAYDEQVASINKAADTVEKFTNSTVSAAERQKAIQRQLQQTGDDAHALYMHIRNLIENSDINIKVNFDAKVPDWMAKMDIKELGRLGKTFAAIAADWKNSGKKGGYVNGKYMSVEDVAQRGVDYGKAADEKLTEQEKKQKEDYRKQQEAEANAKKAKKAAEDAAKRRQQISEENRKWQEQQASQDIATRNAVAELEILGIRDANEKQRKENELEHKKNLQQLDEQEQQFRKENYEHAKRIWEANNTDKSKTFYDTAIGKAGASKYALTDAQQKQLNAAREKEDAKYQKKQNDITKETLKAEQEAMIAYLKAYGTIQEQKLAIEQEYAQKIADIRKGAGSEEQKKWQIQSLEQERNRKISETNANQLARSIDWGATFKGVGNVLGDIARETLKKVSDYMKTAEFKALPAESKKSYTDLRAKLTQETGGNSTSAFNFGIWGKVAEDTKVYQQNIRSLIVWTKNYENALLEQKVAEENLSEATDDAAKEIAQKSLDLAKGKTSVAKAGMQSAQTDVDASQQQLAEDSEKAANGISNFASYLSEMQNGSLSGFANGVSKLVTSLTSGSNGVGKALGELGGKIGGIVGAILSILDALGSDPSQFINELFDKVIGAVESLLSQIASGELVDVIVSGVAELVGNILAHALTDPINAITSAFGMDDLFGGSSDPELEKDIERLTASNEALQKSIDLLADKMEDATSMGEVTYTYEQQRENLEKSIANTQEMMYRSAIAYSNGTMGIGGKRTSVSHLADEAEKMYGSKSVFLQQVSAAAGTAITSFRGIFEITSEQMKNLAMNAPELYAFIKEHADDGYKNASQYMDTYIEYQEQLDELLETYREKMTDVDFDSVESEFKSLLEDMYSDTDDFADNVEEALRNAVINSMMVNTYSAKLKAWYQKFAESMESDGGLNEKEVSDLRDEYNDIVADAMKQRDEMKKLGLDMSSSSSQSASSGSWESMGQDTADELNGRFTALQIAGEDIATSMISTLEQVQGLLSVQLSTNGMVGEIRNMMVMTNSHLEDMVKYAKSTYSDFGAKLDNIHKRLKEM